MNRRRSGNDHIKRLLWSMSLLITFYVKAQIQSNSIPKFYQSQNKKAIQLYLDSARLLSHKTPLRAIDKVNKAIELSLEDKNTEGEAESYYVLGTIQQYLSQHDLALDNFQKCLTTLQATPSRSKLKRKAETATSNVQGLRFLTYKAQAISYLEQNLTGEASNAIARCLETPFAGSNKTELFEVKRIMADVLLKQGKRNEAIYELNDILTQEQETSNNEGIGQTYLRLATAHQQTRNDKKAIEYLNMARQYAEKSGNVELIVYINNQLAQIFRQQKNITKELEVRNNSIDVSQTKLSNTKEAAFQNTEIGKAYVSNNESDKAIPFLEKGLLLGKGGKLILDNSLFKSSNDLESMASAYKLLAQEYVKKGDSEKALMFLETFVQIQDSIKHIRKRELDQALELSREIGKNQQKVDLLEKEKALNQQSIQILKQDQQLKEDELTTRNSIIGTLALVTLFLIGSILLILKSARDKRRANQLLAIKSLRGQMNPHFIFNALNAVNHYISQNDERAANKYLSDFSKLMRAVMETSKHDFIPLNEEIELLKLYVQLEHARFKDHFNYTFQVDEALDTSDFEIPPMIIQPFIENAVWHGLRYTDTIGLLQIDFRKTDEGLCVSITDNGIGRQKSQELKTKHQKQQHSTGMQNIDSRIRILNELFNINIQVSISDANEHAAQKGTKVVLMLPKHVSKHA